MRRQDENSLELLAHIFIKLSLCQTRSCKSSELIPSFVTWYQNLSPHGTFTEAWDERGIQRVKLGAKKCRVRKDIAEIMDLLGRGDGSCS
jgi:hypothetical protein